MFKNAKEYCCRCRCRPVRTIETDSESHLAADKLCIECSIYAQHKQLRDCADAFLLPSGSKSRADAIRIFIATMLPTHADLVNDLGPRAHLAEHLAEKAGRALVDLAGFIHADDWVPPTRKPKDARSKEWAKQRGETS